MQQQITTSLCPAGFFCFEPDIPSIIFDSLGGFIGMSRFRASSLMYSANCLRFNVRSLSNPDIFVAEILGFYAPEYLTFDAYFYDENGDCLSHHFCLDKGDLVQVFNSI